MKILISDTIAQECIDIFDQEKSLKVDIKTDLSPQDLESCINEYSALIIRSSTQVTENVINNATKLKVIGRAGAGVDNIDVKTATKKGIIVMNTPGGNTISTAEHTFSMLLSLSRNIPQANKSITEGNWDKTSFKGVEVYSKTIGIIGLGKIGLEVAKRAQAFNMKVLGYDPFITPEKAAKLDIKLMKVDDICKLSDYITVHTPLSKETKHIISTKQFNMMKKNLRILNCARGGIIDENALYQALISNKISGAALDVFEIEPPKDNPLLTLPSVIATPHLGASTEEAQVNVAIAIGNQVRDVLINNTIKNAINAPSFEGEIYEQVKPYLKLAEKIGKMHAFLLHGTIKSLSIEYHGSFLDYDYKPITSAVIQGILTPPLKDGVNAINARSLADERGIKIIELTRQESDKSTALINVKINTDKSEKVIAGTVFNKNDYRIVNIDQYYLDNVKPNGHMLIYANEDVPGIIGKIGTLLGENGINIANMSLGRDNPNGTALTALNLDSSIPEKILNQLESDKDFIWVKQFDLG